MVLFNLFKSTVSTWLGLSKFQIYTVRVQGIVLTSHSCIFQGFFCVFSVLSYLTRSAMWYFSVNTFFIKSFCEIHYTQHTAWNMLSANIIESPKKSIRNPTGFSVHLKRRRGNLLFLDTLPCPPHLWGLIET